MTLDQYRDKMVKDQVNAAMQRCDTLHRGLGIFDDDCGYCQMDKALIEGISKRGETMTNETNQERYLSSDEQRALHNALKASGKVVAEPKFASSHETNQEREAFEKMDALVSFLLGEGEYMGLQFGDSVKYGRVQARFWWRNDLRKLWSAARSHRPKVSPECVAVLLRGFTLNLLDMQREKKDAAEVVSGMINHYTQAILTKLKEKGVSFDVEE